MMIQFLHKFFQNEDPTSHQQTWTLNQVLPYQFANHFFPPIACYSIHLMHVLLQLNYPKYFLVIPESPASSIILHFLPNLPPICTALHRTIIMISLISSIPTKQLHKDHDTLISIHVLFSLPMARCTSTATTAAVYVVRPTGSPVKDAHVAPPPAASPCSRVSCASATAAPTSTLSTFISPLNDHGEFRLMAI